MIEKSNGDAGSTFGKEWRIFAVYQISACCPLNEPATEKLSQDKRQEVIDGFGAFLGDLVHRAVNRVSHTKGDGCLHSR
jgi:hypothetical protein